jgi:hypothetical protein
MMDRIENLPAGVTGVRAKAIVTKTDYDRIIGPMARDASQKGQRLHFLYHLPPDVEGFTPRAALEDIRIGLRYPWALRRCAVVSSKSWIQKWARLAGAVSPCDLRVYEESELNQAKDWLAEPTKVSHLSHNLISELGTLTIEPTGPLTEEDWEALAATVNPWLRKHHRLKGVVIRAVSFPGWEDFWAMLGNLRFVRNHRDSVDRVALAYSGALARWAEILADRFTSAEVARFESYELQRAVRWASGVESDTVSQPSHGQPPERGGKQPLRAEP